MWKGIFSNRDFQFFVDITRLINSIYHTLQLVDDNIISQITG